MIKDLTEQYPDLLVKCRQWDCGFSEAIKKIEEKKPRLTKFFDQN